MNAAQSQRASLLEHVFERIARTRMLGVPVQNLQLRVQALGFVAGQERCEGREPDQAAVLTGILITPWFMNLVRLPEVLIPPGATVLAPGTKARRTLNAESFEFIGSFEEELGAFEACSLFSPMFEFADHQGAVATAVEVLALLRKQVPAAPQPPTIPGRRGFLLGRPSLSTHA